MATFTLDTSTLSGEQFQIIPFDMDGEFRDIQIHFYQGAGAGGVDQDLEVHYIEFHYTITGVSKEAI